MYSRVISLVSGVYMWEENYGDVKDNISNSDHTMVWYFVLSWRSRESATPNHTFPTCLSIGQWSHNGLILCLVMALPRVCHTQPHLSRLLIYLAVVTQRFYTLSGHGASESLPPPTTHFQLVSLLASDHILVWYFVPRFCLPSFSTFITAWKIVIMLS
mgnify:CR=1 FL=1